MAESPDKPGSEYDAEDGPRATQRRLFRRNQVFGMLILAALIVLWRLFHTNLAWLFPPHWWRP